MSGLLRPIMLPFTTATIDVMGTTGCAAWYFEPSRPRFSAPCHTNSAERRPGCCFQARAIASSATLVDALSSAPFQIESPMIGKRTPS